MFFKRMECGLEMRKYLYGIGLVAFFILLGSYWYLNYFLDEIGFDAPEYRMLLPPYGAGPFAKNIDPPRAQLGVAAIPVALPVTGEASFTTIVRDILPTVVNVSTQNNSARQNPNPAIQSPIAEGVMKFASPFSGVAWESIGSGVIVTTDGYIVSNYHVVENSRNVFVTVFGPLGNQRYPAEVVSSDATRDLVLLKIKTTQPLQVATLGNSDELQVGESVITVGCPFGLDQTVSRGIVSGLRKMVTIEGVIHSDLVQTDAAINQGNSGGPLVSTNGQVVGINTAIYSSTQAFSGVGFAVPVNTVRDFLSDVIVLPDGGNAPLAAPVVATRTLPPPIPANAIAAHENRGPCENCHQIMRTGQLVAQYTQPPANSMMDVTGRNVALPAAENALGATFKAVDPYLIQRFRSPFDGGVFVVRVDPDTPAAQGGLIAADLIFKCNGRWVRTPEELQTMINGIPAGRRIRLGLMRNRERREIVITMAGSASAAVVQPVAVINPDITQGINKVIPNAVMNPGINNPSPSPLPPATPQAPVKTEFEWQGMELQPITAAMVSKDPTLKDKSGTVVQEIDPGLAADKAGLKANDIILAINSLPVASNNALDNAITATNQARTIILDVERGGQPLLITLQ